MEKKSTGKPGRIWFRNWNQRTLSSKSFLCMVFSLLMCRQILSRFSISLEAWTNIAFLIGRWKDEKETSQDLGSSLVGFTSQPIIEIYSYYGAKVKYDYELYHTIWKWYYSFSLSYEWIICRLQSILLFLECTHDSCSSLLHLVLHCNWLILGEPIFPEVFVMLPQFYCCI
jgi:hypothetical protein